MHTRTEPTFCADISSLQIKYLADKAQSDKSTILSTCQQFKCLLTEEFLLPNLFFCFCDNLFEKFTVAIHLTCNVIIIIFKCL